MNLNILSLFDGMSCLQIALIESGYTVAKYYSSEIDKHAIKQTQFVFPDTIQVGDVVFLRKAMTWKDSTYFKYLESEFISETSKDKMVWLRNTDWSFIDLIGAGSPCQGLSFAGKQLKFEDPRSRLFFEFVKIYRYIKKCNPDVKFLLENVAMDKQSQRVINDLLGLFPVKINSELVSAQNRKRLYWTNIRTRKQGLFGDNYTDIPQPEDEGILLKSVLEDDVDDKYYISNYRLGKILKEKPRINPDKSYALTQKNNNPTQARARATTLVGVLNDNGVLRESQKSTCIDANYWKGMDNHAQRTNIFQILKDKDVLCVAMRGRNPEDPSDRTPGNPTEQRLEPKTDGKTNCITSVQKDNLILQMPHGYNKGGVFDEKSPTVLSSSWEHNNLVMGSCRLRRLTPLECLRLQTIPDWYKFDPNISETQQYKMIGNGWTNSVIIHILSFM
jgi:DNA-cytosine methyltransferase